MATQRLSNDDKMLDLGTGSIQLVGVHNSKLVWKQTYFSVQKYTYTSTAGQTVFGGDDDDGVALRLRHDEVKDFVSVSVNGAVVSFEITSDNEITLSGAVSADAEVVITNERTPTDVSSWTFSGAVRDRGGDATWPITTQLDARDDVFNATVAYVFDSSAIDGAAAPSVNRTREHYFAVSGEFPDTNGLVVDGELVMHKQAVMRGSVLLYSDPTSDQ